MTDQADPRLAACADLPPPLRESAQRVLADLLQHPALAACSAQAGWLQAAPRVLATSDFVADLCLAQPQILAGLIDSGRLQAAEDARP